MKYNFNLALPEIVCLNVKLLHEEGEKWQYDCTAAPFPLLVFCCLGHLHPIYEVGLDRVP